ncbi:MAG TPA: DUF4388 domain-containing protein [Polyangiaceae bacterium]|nr:DUF4388 domain-containing protein [Polyangiaceae bacterium]
MNTDFPRTSFPESEPPTSTGFAARLEGASLAELIQIECLRGVRRIIRVTSEGRIGYLFFDQGQVVHATAAGRVGDSAAMWLLSWKNGTFEATEQPWPLRTTIQSSWQNLLLTAAHREDEEARESLPDSSEVIAAAKVGVSDASGEFTRASAAPASETHAPEEMPVTEANSTDPEVLRAVRMDAEGNVLSHVGVVGEFADISAYAVRLSVLIGEALGLEGFQGIECTSDEHSFLAFWDDDTIVALEAKAGADIDQYRKRAGL